MTTIALRPARPGDAGDIAAIWHQGWRDGHLGHVPEALARVRTADSFRVRAEQRAEQRVAQPAEQRAQQPAGQRAGQPVGDTVVACVGANVAGFVMVVGDEVEQVYVSGDHRGTGVAAALLAEAERLVRDGGHRRAWLAVVAGNARARRFYERHGWTDEGPFEYPAAGEDGPVSVPARRYVKQVDG